MTIRSVAFSSGHEDHLCIDVHRARPMLSPENLKLLGKQLESH